MGFMCRFLCVYAHFGVAACYVPRVPKATTRVAPAEWRGCIYGTAELWDLERGECQSGKIGGLRGRRSPPCYYYGAEATFCA